MLTDKKQIKELENQIKQDLMQKDKETIIELYLQMKFERDYCQKQLEMNHNQKAVEILQFLKMKVSTLFDVESPYKTIDEAVEDFYLLLDNTIDQLIKEYGGKE